MVAYYISVTFQFHFTSVEYQMLCNKDIQQNADSFEARVHITNRSFEKPLCLYATDLMTSQISYSIYFFSNKMACSRGQEGEKIRKTTERTCTRDGCQTASSSGTVVACHLKHLPSTPCQFSQNSDRTLESNISHRHGNSLSHNTLWCDQASESEA